MGRLILDTCALVHGQRMHCPTPNLHLVELVDRFFQSPTYLMPNALRIEWGAKHAPMWLKHLEAQKRVERVPNDAKLARTFHKDLRRKFKGRAPGYADAGFLRVAEAEGVCVVTADSAFYHVGRTRGKTGCFDLVDMLILLKVRGVCDLSDIDTALGQLSGMCPSYQPDGWSKIRNAGGTWPDARDKLLNMRRTKEELLAAVEPYL